MVKSQQLFGNLDFKTLAANPDFKEDSVREVIILPILKALGYTQEKIVRSKTLKHPFLKTGSNKKVPVKLVPDYILKGLELGFLDLLKKEYSDLTPLLMNSFDYDADAEIFTIRKDTKFTTQIDVRLRIKYYLLSYLRRKERENKIATFDEILLEILPLLKNGSTPENQTVLTVLESVGERVGTDGWRLKHEGQGSLFGNGF